MINTEIQTAMTGIIYIYIWTLDNNYWTWDLRWTSSWTGEKRLMWLAAPPCSRGKLIVKTCGWFTTGGGFNYSCYYLWTVHCTQAWISHCAAVKKAHQCCSALSNCLFRHPINQKHLWRMVPCLALCFGYIFGLLKCIFVELQLHCGSLFALIGPKDLGGL